MTPPPPPLAYDWRKAPYGAYGRISLDAIGEGRALGRQEEDNAVIVQRYGIEVSDDEYEDDSITAADPDVIRPSFERLVKDLELGKINGIVVYHLDRLLRQQADLGRLLTLWRRAEKQGREIKPILTFSNQFDLHDQMGVQFATMTVMNADNEIRNIRRRVTRSHLDNARKGRIPGGIRPFGWAENKRDLHPIESKAVREAVFDLMAGEVGWGGIAQRWNEAGLLSPFGKPHLESSVRGLMRKPRLAGISTYKGQILREDEGGYIMGQWEPILTIEEWESYWAVVGVDRGPGASSVGGKFLLSGILRCSRCRRKMHARQHRKTGKGKVHQYCCPPRSKGGCAGISVRADVADALISEVVIQRHEQMAASRMTSVQFAGDEELKRLEEQSEALFEKSLQPGVSDAAKLMRRIDMIDERIADLRREKAVAAARIAREARITGSVREGWDGFPVAKKRQIILDTLQSIIVLPADPPRKGVNPAVFNKARLRPVWIEE